MIPIPNLRVTNLRIDFNVRLSSEQSMDYETGYYKKNKGVLADKRSYSSGVTYSEEFSMRILVEAKAPQMPRGLERVITIMENAIAIINETNGDNEEDVEGAAEEV